MVKLAHAPSHCGNISSVSSAAVNPYPVQHQGGERSYTEHVTLRPSILIPPFPSLVPLDASRLLQTISGVLEAEDLRWIAKADYGQNADRNECLLREIVLSGQVPTPLEWCPREVLELTRWDKPSPDDGDVVFRRCHLLRAFACAMLVRSYGDGTGYDYEGGRAATVLHLLGSVVVLAPRLTNLDYEAFALLAWVTPRLAAREPEDHPFFGLAALWFGLGTALTDPALLALAEWVMDAEDAVSGQWRSSLGVGATGRWLLPLVDPRAEQKEWQRLGLSLPERVPPHCSQAVREVVALLAALMDE